MSAAKEVLSDFADNTTAHGLSRINGSRNLRWRVRVDFDIDDDVIIGDIGNYIGIAVALIILKVLLLLLLLLF